MRNQECSLSSPARNEMPEVPQKGGSEDESRALSGEWMRSVSNVFDTLRFIWGTFSLPCRPLGFAQAPHLSLNSVPSAGRTPLWLLLVTWIWPRNSEHFFTWGLSWAAAAPQDVLALGWREDAGTSSLPCGSLRAQWKSLHTD